jgi:cellulose synthase operon protein C
VSSRSTEPEGAPRRGFSLDVWCDLEEELAVLQIETRAALESDKRRAGHLLFEQGRLLLAADREASAAEAFLRAFSFDPRFRPTLRWSRQLYEARGEHGLVARLLEADAVATGDPLSRVSLLRQQAWLRFSRLGETDRAVEILRAAGQIDASDPATLRLLELIHILSGNSRGHLETLERQIAVETDRSSKAALLVCKAFLLCSATPEASVAALEKACQENPESPTARIYLATLLESQGRFVPLVEMLSAEAALPSATSVRRADLLARAAKIALDRLGDPARAGPLYLKSLEAHVSLDTAQDAFELFLDLDDAESAASVGVRLFEVGGVSLTSSRPALACRVADLLSRRLGHPDAASFWYERSLAEDRSYLPALEGLGSLPPGTVAVERLLAAHRGDLEQIAAPRARARRLFRIAELLESAGRPREAIEAHREAIAASPEHAGALFALERLFVRLERWPELLQLHDEALAKTQSTERTVQILEEMAELWETRLGEESSALECWRRILSIAPPRRVALREAMRLCMATRRYQDYVDLAERELDLVPEEHAARAEILHQCGDVVENQILKVDQAIPYYERAHAQSPSYLPSLRALGRLYRQKGRWDDLLRMHEAEIAVCASDEPTVVVLLTEMAEVYEEELLDAERAIGTHLRILALRPLEVHSVLQLVRLFEAQSDHRRSAEVVELFASSPSLDAGSPPQPGAPLLDHRRLAAILLCRAGISRAERLKAYAASDFERALALAPEVAPFLIPPDDTPPLTSRRPDPKSAAAVLAEARSWASRGTATAELLAALEQLAEAASDERVRLELQLRIGRIRAASGVGDPIPHLRRAARLRSGRLYALRALEGALRARGDAEARAELLDPRFLPTTDPLELASRWTELGELHVERGEIPAAEEAFRQALARAPDHLNALWQLGILLEVQQRWSERAELSERESEATPSPSGRADALLRAALLWEERLADPSRAARLYARVLALDPGQLDAYQRLRALLTRGGEWTQVTALLRAHLPQVTDPGEAARLLVDLGRLYIERLGQPSKATPCLTSALELNPRASFALVTLGDQHYNAGEWREAQDFYRRAVSGPDLDPDTGSRIHRRLGEIHLGLDEPSLALEAFGRAAAAAVEAGAAGTTVGGTVSGDPELLRRMALAAEGAGNAGALVLALVKLSSCSDDPDERAQARRRVAQLATDQLDDEELAVQSLEEVLVIDPFDIESIGRLAAIYGRTGNRAAVEKHLRLAAERHRAELARRPFDERLYRQLARIFQWQHHYDRLYCAYVALGQLRVLTEVEQRFLREQHARCRPIPNGSLTRSLITSLVLPPGARTPIAEILAAASPALQRLAAVERDGLASVSDPRVRSTLHLQSYCDEIAALLGGVEFDLLVSEKRHDLVRAEMLSRPTLVVGARIAQNFIGPAERFRIGRELFTIAENAIVLRGRTVKQVRVLLAAIGRVSIPEYVLRIAVKEPEEIEEEVHRLGKLFTRKERRAIGAVLGRVAASLESIDLVEYTRAVGVAINRAGLVVAGDPIRCLAEAERLGGGRAQSVEMADLLQFVVSDAYSVLRDKLGLPSGVR